MTESTPRQPARRPWRRAPRQLVLNRAPAHTEVQRRLEASTYRFVSGVVDPDTFATELAAEFGRRQRRRSKNCLVATVSIFEIAGIAERLGAGHLFDLITDVTGVFLEHLIPTDIVNISEDGEIVVMARESSVKSAMNRIDKASRALAGRYFVVDGERRLLTPSTGVATLDDGLDAADVIRRAIDAREVAAGHLDLRVHRWEPAMSVDTAPPEKQPFDRFGWQTIKERLRAPTQILATYVLGLVVPFCIYWFFDQVVGFDISWGMYLFCVFTLVSTGVMILVEARLALTQREPPEVADEDFPLATAIICAYLPNEAGTILETIDGFLNNGYAGGIQIILAYNSPTPMAVEKDLHRLSDIHPNLDIVRVEGSTSKAQNVNAVLHMAKGAFTGMFDADHMPRPGSFERAWRWMVDGYSVVQGHCLTRNGDETWLAKMIAVEFESIYAVAHPGRARLHRFGVFGGSNGYWRTELLHETRMRGSMLTEDIDSSMRTVERGLKIRSDRDIVSRELGTTTFKQVWNQRLRWAQGWWQVTIMHTLRVWRSPGLNLRQKFGATYLLGWREVYPWLSLQVFPLVAFWIWRGDELSSGFPFFFFTTLFVLHIGPVQTWFAYRLADEEIKVNKNWFWAYLFFSTIFYTEYKNTIARVAHIKEFVGERAWKVTPRSSDGEDHDASAAPAADGSDAPDAGADGADDEPASAAAAALEVHVLEPGEELALASTAAPHGEVVDTAGGSAWLDGTFEGQQNDLGGQLPRRRRGATLHRFNRYDERMLAERFRHLRDDLDDELSVETEAAERRSRDRRAGPLSSDRIVPIVRPAQPRVERSVMPPPPPPIPRRPPPPPPPTQQPSPAREPAESREGAPPGAI